MIAIEFAKFTIFIFIFRVKGHTKHATKCYFNKILGI